MLVYLIYLRRNRMEAERWLQNNRNILFNSALGLKSEEEILEALVKKQKMEEKMSNPSVQMSLNKQSNASKSGGTHLSDEDDKGQPLLQNPGSSKAAAKGIHTDSDEDDKGSKKSDKQAAPRSTKTYSENP